MADERKVQVPQVKDMPASQVMLPGAPVQRIEKPREGRAIVERLRKKQPNDKR